jgi:transposase-like protein
MLDGLWIKLLVPTGEHLTDRLGRRRARVRRISAPLLLAYGVDPRTGERWVLDWQRADGEDEASWRVLLERLHARGLHADAGLEVFLHDGSSGLEAAFGLVDFGPDVLHQRCVFHVLRNLGDAVQGAPEMTRAAKRAHRQTVVQQAAAIWQATTRAEVLRRQQRFVAAWREHEPGVVATLERVWPSTLAYLEALARAQQRGEVWQPQYLRATSLLERANRSFRQKARQVSLFHSETSLEAAVALVVLHRSLGPWSTPLPWTHTLEALLAA